jgi:hypothetical protein
MVTPSWFLMTEYILLPPDWISKVKLIKAPSKADALDIYINVFKLNLNEWRDEVTEAELDDFIDKVPTEE